MLVFVIIIAPAAFAKFFALRRLLVVLAHLALDCRDGFQFLRRIVPLPLTVAPSSKSSCLAIRRNQVFPGEELVCPEITFLSVHHPPMPFRRLGRERFWRG